ncbi:Mitochondrial phosphate carrier protein 2 mitochondrial [Zea mays]|uniref:Mitochondrial phosphate carrier protein 2 mitochondrial n=1 Tax=Zea mays TaxID=4577 RepID=A0A1D6I5R0_MAIZE|nr:Mitochondrial phosphate carrier protein 2 mitochondrial [Zea mays]
MLICLVKRAKTTGNSAGQRLAERLLLLLSQWKDSES